MKAKRFRVALSYSREKQAFVEEVATGLAAQFGEAAILYDKFHVTDFARVDLSEILPDLYRDSSDLIVVLASPGYPTSPWCRLEWRAVHGMMMSGRHQEIILCNFDGARPPGVYEGSGVIDLDRMRPSELVALVLKHLGESPGLSSGLVMMPSNPPPPHPVSSTPHPLPRLPRLFGRDEELGRIKKALDPREPGWGIVIHGAGGLGKTSLAIQTAHDCRSQFTRTIILSVKAQELEDDGERKLDGYILAEFHELLNEIAHELGSPEVATAPRARRLDLLRAALRAARALLILDSVERLPGKDRGSLLDLVRGLPSDCKAILTSRDPIGDARERLPLRPLGREAAKQILAEIAEQNPTLKLGGSERDALLTMTHGNPLLLRWTVGQVGRESCNTLKDALELLRRCPKKNDPFEYIFGDMLRACSKDEKRVLVALIYFSPWARVDHLVELAGVRRESVGVALRIFSNRSLIVSDEEGQVYSLVPMVDEFVRRMLPQIVSETDARLAEGAHSLILGNGYGQQERFHVLESAWPLLSAALRLPRAGESEWVQDVCEALAKFLFFSGRWGDWHSLEEQAESMAVSGKDHVAAGWHAMNLSYIAQLRGNAGRVGECGDRAEAHWRRGGSFGAKEAAAVHRARGAGLQLRRDHEGALAEYQEALKHARAMPPGSKTVAVVLNGLAGVARAAGHPRKARRHYQEALKAAREVDYREGVVAYTGNLAGLACDMEDWTEAEALSRQALEESEALGRMELIASNNQRLALALARQGKHSDAMPFARGAVEGFTQLGSPHLAGARDVLRACEA